MAKELAELLNVELNLTNIIPDNLRSESVRGHIKNMLDVIEETLRFIEARMNSYSLGERCKYNRNVHIFYQYL